MSISRTHNPSQEEVWTCIKHTSVSHPSIGLNKLRVDILEKNPTWQISTKVIPCNTLDLTSDKSSFAALEDFAPKLPP